jgi:hypothetical protein
MLCAAAPFAFAVIRAVRTGNDLRYFWLAIVGALGAAVVIALGWARSSRALVAQCVATFVVATLLVAGVSFLLEGRAAGAGIWVVAVAFGLCFAASSALLLLSRPRTISQ